MAKVLSGIRVIEQGTFITGPNAGMLLADLGAEVIKVEQPGSGDPFRAFQGGYVCVDLESCTVSLPDGVSISFKIEPNVQEKLLNGWDDIELTLKHVEKIRTFEASRWQQLPWLAPKLNS